MKGQKTGYSWIVSTADSEAALRPLLDRNLYLRNRDSDEAVCCSLLTFDLILHSRRTVGQMFRLALDKGGVLCFNPEQDRLGHCCSL